MTVFYWVMSGLILSTLVPSLGYLLLYAGTGERACLRRAQALWSVSRVLTLLSFNLLIWGHVLVALWHLKFR